MNPKLNEAFVLDETRSVASPTKSFIVTREDHEQKLRQDSGGDKPEKVPEPDCHSTHSHLEERWQMILLQIIVPFFIAGFGMVGAGIILNIVQYWELYKEINQIFTLVPSLLGLKGNLEMTLAARLSTQVNLGAVSNKENVKHAVIGNIVLVQAQSIVVGFLASFVACLTDLIKNGHVESDHLLTLISTSVTTASLASLFLGAIMIAIILMSKRFKINPDNVATPIAASLGDVVTLGILSYVGTFFYEYRHAIWVPILFITLFLLVLPLFFYICYKNPLVKDTIVHGWVPIIVAMVISSLGGIILSFAVVIYESLTSYQPVINGVGGNLVAIFASRLSTVIHRTGSKGVKPSWAPKRLITYPYETFFGKQNPENKTALVLISLTIPGHLIFFMIIYFLESKHELPLTAWLVILYLLVAFTQVLVLFLLCYWLVIFIWKLGKNPDNHTIPYLTSIGDLIGIGLLFVAFLILDKLGVSHYPEMHTTDAFNLTNSTTDTMFWSTTLLQF